MKLFEHKSTEQAKQLLEMSDVYKHIMKGLIKNELLSDDLKEIDELIINKCAKNRRRKNRLIDEFLRVE